MTLTGPNRWSRDWQITTHESEGRTHGIRATYNVCRDGDDGKPCAPCREAERVYKADYRRRKSSALDSGV